VKEESMRRWTVVFVALVLVVPVAASAQVPVGIPAAIADLQARVAAIETQLASRPVGTQRARGLRIRGDGDAVSQPFALREGTAIFTIKVQGSGLNAVDLLSAPGTGQSQYASLLFPQSEAYQGTVAEPIFASGEYVLEVGAAGPWLVIVEQ
jgi:hypothetical protein